MLVRFGRVVAIRHGCFALMLGLFLLGTWTSNVAQAAQAGARKARTHASAKKKSSKRLSRAAAAKARAEARAKAEAEAIAAGKAAVFAFEGDETDPLRRRVIRLLQANGMRVRTDLRPNDTAEQFRDMGAALDLAIYVHGRVRDLPGGRSVATFTIRSGVTGGTIASAIFRGDRRELPSLIDDGLWQKVQKPVARACTLALKPRRHNAPMRIEAGTPIEDTRPEPSHPGFARATPGRP